MRSKFATLYGIAVLTPAALSAQAVNAAAPTLRLAPATVQLDRGVEIAVEQGTLTVPLDRDGGAPGTLELHVVRVPGEAGPAATPTLYLAGGPGGAATGLLRGPGAVEVVAAFRRLGDLVLLDQRGTGRSTPSPRCPRSEPLPADLFVDGERTLRAMREEVARCAAQWRARGIEPMAFDSQEAAEDLEDLRRALGVERMNLVGFSYGTHLALTVMRRHPASLGRVALVGTEGPAHTWKLPTTLDVQLRKISHLAAADPAIREQVPDMMALLSEVLARLEGEPVAVTVRDRAADRDLTVRVGRWGLLRLLRWDVGDGNDFVAFPALLHGIANGDTTLLARYVEKRWNGLAAGVALMPIATDCASGASPTRRARIDAEEPASVFGAVTNSPYPEICAALGDPDLGEDHRAPLLSAVPTLLVSGSLDSNTPPFQAEEVRWGLTRATHLVVENAGHEDTLPHPEVQRAILEFLAGGEVAGRHIALPAPRFLSLAAARDFRP